MDSVQHKLDVKVLRAGKIADTHNFFCEIPEDSHRHIVISIAVGAMPHRHTRALVSLIQAGDKVAFDFTTDVPDEHGIRRVGMLHSVVNQNCLPDPAEYGSS